jgi:hypothetical protein
VNVRHIELRASCLVSPGYHVNFTDKTQAMLTSNHLDNVIDGDIHVEEWDE